MRTIPLTQGKEAIIDDDMFDIITRRRWRTQRRAQTCYAHSGIADNYIMMHHLVIGVPLPNYSVDHINRNGLDNRRENLRVIPTYLNNANSKSITSIYPGVYFHKKSKKWMSRITISGEKIYLGIYTNEDTAFIAYCEAANLFGRELLPEHEELWKQLR